VLEDSQAADVAKSEKEEASEALKAINKRKDAIAQRRKFEVNKLLDNEASDVTSEQKQEAEKKFHCLIKNVKDWSKKKKRSKQYLV